MGIPSIPYWDMRTETGAHPTHPTEAHPKENRHRYRPGNMSDLLCSIPHGMPRPMIHRPFSSEAVLVVLGSGRHGRSRQRRVSAMPGDLRARKPTEPAGRTPEVPTPFALARSRVRPRSTSWAFRHVTRAIGPNPSAAPK